mmetsp:Transcript_7398/g.24121  ORF Transcript_7398/g.24121 Transcript_7398/m.24121 type:complete len:201 (-) Transcript_7398:25-627(-)
MSCWSATSSPSTAPARARRRSSCTGLWRRPRATSSRRRCASARPKAAPRCGRRCPAVRRPPRPRRSRRRLSRPGASRTTRTRRSASAARPQAARPTPGQASSTLSWSWRRARRDRSNSPLCHCCPAGTRCRASASPPLRRSSTTLRRRPSSSSSTRDRQGEAAHRFSSVKTDALRPRGAPRDPGTPTTTPRRKGAMGLSK